MSRPRWRPSPAIIICCIFTLSVTAALIFSCANAHAESRWIAGPKINNGWPYGVIGLKSDTLGNFILRQTIDLGGQEWATQSAALYRIKQFHRGTLWLNLGPNLEGIKPDDDNSRRIALLSIAIGAEYTFHLNQTLSMCIGAIRITPAQAIKPYKIYLFITTPI